MEKQGAIKPGMTPTEREEQAAAAVKSASDQILALDADFRKRAAESFARVDTTK